jgi:hypothetical protein
MKQSATSELNFPLTIRAIGNLLTIQVTPLKGPSWADMMDEEDEETERMHDQPATSKLDVPAVIRIIRKCLTIQATPPKGPSPADEMDEENGKGVLPEFGHGKKVTAAQRDLQKTDIVLAADSSMKKPKVTIQHRTNWKNQKSCRARRSQLPRPFLLNQPALLVQTAQSISEAAVKRLSTRISRAADYFISIYHCHWYIDHKRSRG